MVERALLVGLQPPGTPPEEVEELLSELADLADTLGVPVVGRLVAHLRQPQSRYLVGTGKAGEIVDAARRVDADVIIFDDLLSPAQQRNWEALADIAVIDRQEVILDIFSQRARTKEAVLQVELARAKYNLPRLKRMWTHLSRQSGGSAAQKGEGEQQIELDSRLIRTRISRLEQQLEEVRKQRQVQRQKRLRKPVPVAAIIGYTNAGKSRLLNALTNAEVFTENKLFATLDPTVKRIQLANNQDLLLTDTVGFVRKLPHQLVEAFKATLEETVTADFLIEVLDVTSDQLEEHHRTTRQVMEEIGAEDKPVVTVFNKVDLPVEEHVMHRLRRQNPGAAFTSALTGQGLDELKKCLESELNRSLREVTLQVPHERHDIIALLHRTSRIIEEKYTEEGASVEAAVPLNILGRVEKFAKQR
jgi:GTP-binding protein HflX